MDSIQLKNKKLAEKYPFLAPRNVWTDEIDGDYDYGYLLLTDYTGWWKRFGIPLCEDLKNILIRNNCLDKFRFSQVKEKYGSLRLYDFGAPQEWHTHLFAWEYISAHTCMKCGAFPISMKDDGWIIPYCDNCWAKIHPHDDINRKDDTVILEKELKITQFSTDGDTVITIDLIPFYESIGYKMT